MRLAAAANESVGLSNRDAPSKRLVGRGCGGGEEVYTFHINPAMQTRSRRASRLPLLLPEKPDISEFSLLHRNYGATRETLSVRVGPISATSALILKNESPRKKRHLFARRRRRYVASQNRAARREKSTRNRRRGIRRGRRKGGEGQRVSAIFRRIFRRPGLCRPNEGHYS